MDDRDDKEERGFTTGEYFPGTSSDQETPPRKPSRRGWVIQVAILVVVLLVVLVAAGILIDRLYFGKKQSGDFRLSASPSYREALDDKRGNFYRDYSEAKITGAAQKAVDREKKKGVKSEDKLEDAGLRALVKALDDEHTDYLDPKENKMLGESLSGSFYGIGFMLRMDKERKRPKVVSIIKGSPSERAGVKKNDIIMSIDGKDTKGKRLDLVVGSIRGKNGTTVEIKVYRPDTRKNLVFKITREKIVIPDIESEILDGRYGYIHVLNFSRGIAFKVRQKVKEMQQKGVQGFILDVRNDPGGLLDEAVKLSSVFIKDGVIVSYQRKGQGRIDEKAQGGAETDLPLVVLTNGGSASSSEIVAGALKDRGRATLVGSKTYGKGSIQKMYELENMGAAKLTVSMYYLPNGESIDGKGIVPDVKVELKDEAEKEEQLQLDKAKEVLQRLIQGNLPTGALLLRAA